jgi:hypothetical protein
MPISKIARARAFARANPSASTAEIMAASGLGDRRARLACQQVRQATNAPAPAAESPPPVSINFEAKADSAIASSCSARIKTLDQLLAAAKVDLTVWEVERHVINKWEVGAIPRATGSDEKGWERKSSAVMIEPLWQVKIWLKRKTPQERGLRAALAAQIAEARAKAPAPRPIAYRKLHGECMAEIDIPDLHLGKLCWAAESGENFDVKIAEGLFMEALARHRDAAAPYGIKRFLFPIGNDYLNVDNAARTTTAGTVQDEDGRWQRSYTRGRQLLARAIEYLRQVAPVHVIHIGGNHDYERGFYLADALACQFSKQADVSFDIGPAARKYVRHGAVLIGFTHGDKEPVKDLPLTMAVEVPREWAATRFREFHLGHLHHKRERDFQPVLEEKSVIVRHLSSLTAADAWHAGKGYRTQRASSCFIWHAKRGCLAELTYNL